MLMTIAEKVRIDFQSGVEVKSTQIKYVVNSNLTKMHDMLGRSGIHVL
jgi:hypothetical protein